MFVIIQILKGIPVVTSIHYTFDTAVTAVDEAVGTCPYSLPTIQVVSNVTNGSNKESHSFILPKGYSIDPNGRVYKWEK